MDVIGMQDTKITVDISSQVRGEGQRVWSCHSGEFSCTLGTLQALLSALGHGQDLFVEASDCVYGLIVGDFFESATLLTIDEENREVNIEIALDKSE